MWGVGEVAAAKTFFIFDLACGCGQQSKVSSLIQ